MIRSFTICMSTCIACLCLLSPLSAQEIPAEVRALFGKLEGTWQIDVSIDGQRGTDELTCKRTPGNDGIVWYWKGKDLDSGQVATSTGLIGWDGQKGAVVEHMVSSNGVTFSSVWSGKGDRWTTRNEGTELIEGKYLQTYEDRVFEWESDDKWIIITKNRLRAGEQVPDMKGVFTRTNE